MGHAVGGDRVCVKASIVSHVASTVSPSVAVQQFVVVAFGWHADSIVITRNRGEITHTQNMIILILGSSDEGDHGMDRIVEVDPLETGPVVIDFV